VDDVVAVRCEPLDQPRREVLVDEELHAGRRRGSSRSRTASAA
jgi:hypothetical protein